MIERLWADECYKSLGSSQQIILLPVHYIAYRFDIYIINPSGFCKLMSSTTNKADHNTFSIAILALATK